MGLLRKSRKTGVSTQHAAIATIIVVGAVTILGNPALAKPKPTDEPIAPKAVPVPAVNATPLEPANEGVTHGELIAVDGSTLLIANHVVQIYGIAAPDIHATFGPEARLSLDHLTMQKRVDCTRLDQRENLIIASCKIGDDDLGEMILRSGYAATYRTETNPTADELALSTRYTAVEEKARAQRIGIWVNLPTALGTDAAPAAETPKEIPQEIPRSTLQLWLDRLMIDSHVFKAWIIAAPILLIALIALICFNRSTNRHWQQEREQIRLGATSLLAQVLAEVLAIREAANEQVQSLNHLPQDRPVPAGQLAIMGLPPALIYAANAGQLYRLPRDTGVDLVQFYAAHAGIGQMLRQALHLRADSLRHAYIKIVEAADLVLERGQKQLD